MQIGELMPHAYFAGTLNLGDVLVDSGETARLKVRSSACSVYHMEYLPAIHASIRSFVRDLHGRLRK